jgi:hypothetical protein
MIWSLPSAGGCYATTTRYRRYARQCLEMAPTFQDKEARATLRGFAQNWSRLAHLAIANQHIAELMVQIAQQRAVVKHAVDRGQRLADARMAGGSRNGLGHGTVAKRLAGYKRTSRTLSCSI